MKALTIDETMIPLVCKEIVRIMSGSEAEKEIEEKSHCPIMMCQRILKKNKMEYLHSLGR